MSISRLRAAFAIVAFIVAPVRAQSSATVAELAAAGDAAWASGHHADARAAYAEIVRRDSSHSRAVFRLATLLAWDNAFDESLTLFRLYRRLEPRDPQGALAVARTLSWASRFSEAIAVYDTLLMRDRGMSAAALGRARTLAWSGKLRESIAGYEEWLRDRPSDADAWTGLATVLRWSGYGTAARKALRRALELQPAHEEARAQLRWVQADLSPSLEPTITTTSDTDHNRSTVYAIGAGFPMLGAARVTLAASHRSAALATLRGSATTGRAVIAWSPANGRWTLRGELGATRLGGGERGGADSSSTELLAGARIAARPGRRVSVGVGVTRGAFDETAALIAAGIVATSIEGDIDVALPARLSLGVGLGRTSLAGGSVENTRRAASGALRWALRRGISFAVGGRTFRYENEARDGYFAPKRFHLIEGSARVSLGRELGWAIESDVGAGSQTIAPFGGESSSRLASRGAVTVLYRWAPGVEWKVTAGLANVASPTALSSAEYRAWHVGIGGKVLFLRR